VDTWNLTGLSITMYIKSEKIIIRHLIMSDLPPRYDGTLQPEVWVQDLRFFCALRGIHDQAAVLNIAILRIDHNIPIPKDIDSFNLLISVLKDHVTHIVFRADSLEKLYTLKCERNMDMSEFVAKFISLCRSANITDREEKRVTFFETCRMILFGMYLGAELKT
jgi:hypothetical protein